MNESTVYESKHSKSLMECVTKHVDRAIYKLEVELSHVDHCIECLNDPDMFSFYDRMHTHLGINGTKCRGRHCNECAIMGSFKSITRNNVLKSTAAKRRNEEGYKI